MAIIDRRTYHGLLYIGNVALNFQHHLFRQNLQLAPFFRRPINVVSTNLFRQFCLPNHKIFMTMEATQRFDFALFFMMDLRKIPTEGG